MAGRSVIPTIGPAVAGSWYPASRSALADLVDRLLDDAAAPEGAPPRIVVAPHAGFMYSGGVAAHAFRPFAGSGAVRRVILIGPSHYVGFRGARVPEAEAYRTPLGDVPLDREVLAGLLEHPAFEADNRPWAREHSLEAEIPFLQRALGAPFVAVPVLVGGSTSPAQVREIAEGLRGAADASTLVVVSSDFTHFGRAFGYVPFERDVAEGLRRLDGGAIDLITAGDADGFARYCDETGATICGRLAIEVGLRLPPAGARGRRLAYDTSGRMTGDWDHTVSYAAIGLAGAAA